jgi:hypothetical protein
MERVMNSPLIVFLISLGVLWLSARTGSFFGKRRGGLDEAEREDFGVIQAASLTLLALIVGFTFSMAVTRYDQRKNYEEAEANAIGTEYVRADLLAAADAAKVRTLLASYLDERVLFYQARNDDQLRKLNASTAQLQEDLWAAAQNPAAAHPSPVTALAVAGMNDVLNSQGYTQFAWNNRIPFAAWSLMGLIAIFSNLLIGYGARLARSKSILLLAVPLLISTSLFLIADIDSPRGGIIRVTPQNLMSLVPSLHRR